MDNGHDKCNQFPWITVKLIYFILFFKINLLTIYKIAKFHNCPFLNP